MKSAATGAGSSSRATATSAICRRPRSGLRARRPTGSPRCEPTPIPGRRSSGRRASRCRSARSSKSKRFDGDFAVTADGLFLYARHLAPIDAREPDFVAVAERFLETPYLWGGRTSEGIDCSGLAQTALMAAGIPAPRDSDMQEAALGQPLPLDDALAHLRRGDLVFWKGHVGIMRDAATLLHANGWAMKVASEPLAEARARIEKSGGGAITSIRRL